MFLQRFQPMHLNCISYVQTHPSNEYVSIGLSCKRFDLSGNTACPGVGTVQSALAY